MALTRKTLLVVLALTFPLLARSETLDCEFTEGRVSRARVDPKTGKWLWMNPAKSASEFYPGFKRGESFWFVNASYSKGKASGTLAGSFARPANEDRAAQVVFGAGFVSLVSVGLNGTSTLTVATAYGKDGTLAAAFFANSGLPESLLAQLYEGFCR